jgi:hypothetical protein
MRPHSIEFTAINYIHFIKLSSSWWENTPMKQKYTACYGGVLLNVDNFSH